MKNRGYVLLISVLVVFFLASYLTFFYHPTCADASCWQAKLSDCKRATYIHNPQDVTWKYTIQGKIENTCEVDVKVIEIKRGLKSTEILEGKEMTCFVPLGSTSAPEANPNRCHGRLKEEMQTLIIQKLHEYILYNIGQIGEEFNSLQGVNLVPTNSSNSGA